VETTRRAGVGGGRSHRLQVRFDAGLLGRIRERSRANGQSLSAIVRQLVATALRLDTEPGSRTDSPAALAALVAAEHAALMVASVLPDGQRLLLALGAQAARAAEERLAIFREGER
jgi:hypothetical protein